MEGISTVTNRLDRSKNKGFRLRLEWKVFQHYLLKFITEERLSFRLRLEWKVFQHEGIDLDTFTNFAFPSPFGVEGISTK